MLMRMWAFCGHTETKGARQGCAVGNQNKLAANSVIVAGRKINSLPAAAVGISARDRSGGGAGERPAGEIRLQVVGVARLPGQDREFGRQFREGSKILGVCLMWVE